MSKPQVFTKCKAGNASLYTRPCKFFFLNLRRRLQNGWYGIKLTHYVGSPPSKPRPRPTHQVRGQHIPRMQPTNDHRVGGPDSEQGRTLSASSSSSGITTTHQQPYCGHSTTRTHQKQTTTHKQHQIQITNRTDIRGSNNGPIKV